jgi:hypothetical protein
MDKFGLLLVGILVAAVQFAVVVGAVLFALWLWHRNKAA